MTVIVVAAIIRRNGKILITRRGSDVHLGGLWEFPGGKVESGESLQQALKREIFEEVGLNVDVLHEFFSVEHSYPTKNVQLHFFDCAIKAGEPEAKQVADIKWISISEFTDFDFPPADFGLIQKLQETSSR